MNSSTASNVTPINTGSIFEELETFLSDFKSVKTITKYRYDINFFLKFIYNGRDASQITKKDIEKFEIDDEGKSQPISNKHVIKYKNYLLELKLSEGSVKGKIYAAKSFFKYLKTNRYKVDLLAFDVKGLNIKPDSYDILTPDEMIYMSELAKYERNGDELSAWVVMAGVTSIRLGALLNVKWTDIRKDDESNLYLVTAFTKGNKYVTMPFEQELYNDLMKIKSKYNSELIFPNLKVDKVEKSVARLALKMGLSEHRWIVPHSLRKVATDYEMNDTGNINKAMQQNKNEKAQTLLDHYVNKKVVYQELAGIRMMKKVDETALEEMSKEDLLAMLKQTNKGVYNQLAIKAATIQ